VTKKEKKVKHMNIIMELSRLLPQINWAIAIPDKNNVDHLVIGKEEIIKKITDELSEDYDLVVKSSN